MSGETYTLAELRDYCIDHGYPEHVETLEGYIDKQASERRLAIVSQPPAFTGLRSVPAQRAWGEVVANRKVAA